MVLRAEASRAVNGFMNSYTQQVVIWAIFDEELQMCADLFYCIFYSLLFWAANGQLQSGYVYNWTSWIEDYGFGKCMDIKKCNVFPDGKPFPQSNDWRRKSYVYVWHTMGEKILHIFTHPKHKIKVL